MEDEMKLTKIAIYGGRHNKIDPINVLVNPDLLEDNPSCQKIVELLISARQWKRVIRHMCGIHGCNCGPSENWQFKIIT
jgi:hypothetical protein